MHNAIWRMHGRKCMHCTTGNSWVFHCQLIVQSNKSFLAAQSYYTIEPNCTTKLTLVSTEQSAFYKSKHWCEFTHKIESNRTIHFSKTSNLRLDTCKLILPNNVYRHHQCWCTFPFVTNGDDFFTSNLEYNNRSWWCPPCSCSWRELLLLFCNQEIEHSTENLQSVWSPLPPSLLWQSNQHL